jgi:hypothetical protein
MARLIRPNGTSVRYHCHVSPWLHRILTGCLTAVVFDATMISLAMLTLNTFHPGIYLRESDYPLPAVTSEDPSLTEYPKTGNVEMRAV